MPSLTSYIEKLDRENLLLFMGCDIKEDTCVKKGAVLFSHSLSTSEASMLLLSLANILTALHYGVFIVSPKDGTMKETFLNIGCNVIVYPDHLKDNVWMEAVAESFDFILVNTLQCAPAADLLSEKSPNVFWWIHESEQQFQNFLLRNENISLTPALQILAESTYVQKCIHKYFHTDSELLSFYIEDIPCNPVSSKREEIRFLMIDNSPTGKGKALLLRALQQLPSFLLNRCVFLIGRDLSSTESGKTAESDPMPVNLPVAVIPAMADDELLSCYDDMDIIIAPSFEESVAAVQAFMKGKICICSDIAAPSDYAHDGKDAFLFSSGDSKELANKITLSIEHFEQLDEMAFNGRKLYERHYSAKAFLKRLLEIILAAEAKCDFLRLKQDKEAAQNSYQYICTSIDHALSTKDYAGTVFHLIEYIENGAGHLTLKYFGKTYRYLRMLHILALEIKYKKRLFCEDCGSLKELWDKYMLTLFSMRRILFRLSERSVDEAAQYLQAHPISPFAAYLMTQDELLIPSRSFYQTLLTILSSCWTSDDKNQFLGLFRKS